MLVSYIIRSFNTSILPQISVMIFVFLVRPNQRTIIFYCLCKTEIKFKLNITN